MFDDTKFELISEVGRVECGRSNLKVIIFRYDGGEKKIKVQREGTKKSGDTYYSDMGNLTPEEAEKVGPLLVQAAKVAKGG